MSQVNFLPPRYLNQAKVRRRKSLHLVMLTGLAVCLATWGFVERAKNARPRIRAVTLEAEVEAARDQMNEVVKLRSERAALLQQQKIKHELNQPVSHTQLVNRLASHLPQSVGLTDLRIVTHRPPPEPIVDPGANKRRTKKAQQDQPPADQLDIELDAVAPDDLTIAQVIGDLSDDPVFDHVAMRFSRSTTVQGVEARLFRLSMRVRLDRKFEVEVAHAD